MHVYRGCASNKTTKRRIKPDLLGSLSIRKMSRLSYNTISRGLGGWFFSPWFFVRARERLSPSTSQFPDDSNIHHHYHHHCYYLLLLPPLALLSFVVVRSRYRFHHYTCKKSALHNTFIFPFSLIFFSNSRDVSFRITQREKPSNTKRTHAREGIAAAISLFRPFVKRESCPRLEVNTSRGMHGDEHWRIGSQYEIARLDYGRVMPVCQSGSLGATIRQPNYWYHRGNAQTRFMAAFAGNLVEHTTRSESRALTWHGYTWWGRYSSSTISPWARSTFPTSHHGLPVIQSFSLTSLP